MLDYGARIGSEEIFDLFILKRLKLRCTLATRHDREFWISAMRTMICAKIESLFYFTKIFKKFILIIKYFFATFDFYSALLKRILYNGMRFCCRNLHLKKFFRI